jgi:hypothetical protein
MVYRPVILLAAVCVLHAQSGPQPPCGTAPFPPYPEKPGTPVVKVWERSDWTPTACTGWSPLSSATLVVTAARFPHPGGIDGLLGRLGAVSRMTGLLYWSTSRQKWERLILDAYALTGPEGERRKDFAPAEMAAGRTLSMHQEDNLLGKAAYDTRIVSRTDDRLVFATRNASTISLLGLSLFQPDEIQSICFLDRESKVVWRYYNVTRMPKQAGLLTMGHDASLVNRAVALYRFLAGIPADQEPPAAR